MCSVNSPKGKLDFIMSEVNIIVNGENCVRLNQREWKETIVQTVLPNAHHLQTLLRKLWL
jgi:hypothetical protein